MDQGGNESLPAGGVCGCRQAFRNWPSEGRNSSIQAQEILEDQIFRRFTIFYLITVFLPAYVRFLRFLLTGQLRKFWLYIFSFQKAYLRGPTQKKSKNKLYKISYKYSSPTALATLHIITLHHSGHSTTHTPLEVRRAEGVASAAERARPGRGSAAETHRLQGNTSGSTV